MVVVNKIDIKGELIENCADFASTFSQRITWHASKFDEVRVIFDRYDVKALKGNTRAGGSKGFMSQLIIKSLTPQESVTRK